MRYLLTAIIILGINLANAQTAYLKSYKMTPLSLVNDSWETGPDTKCNFTAELGTDYVKVYSSKKEILLNTNINLLSVENGSDNTTFLFTVPNEETALVQYLIYKDKTNPVVGLLWVSSRSSGKGIILELKLKNNQEHRYIKGE